MSWHGEWREQAHYAEAHFPIDTKNYPVLATTETDVIDLKTSDGSWPIEAGTRSNGIITGWAQAKYAEAYTISAHADDYVRVYWDGVLVIPATDDLGTGTWVSPVLSPIVPHEVRVECINDAPNSADNDPGDLGHVTLKWQSASQTLELIPEGLRPLDLISQHHSEGGKSSTGLTYVENSHSLTTVDDGKLPKIGDAIGFSDAFGEPIYQGQVSHISISEGIATLTADSVLTKLLNVTPDSILKTTMQIDELDNPASATIKDALGYILDTWGIEYETLPHFYVQKQDQSTGTWLEPKVPAISLVQDKDLSKRKTARELLEPLLTAFTGYVLRASINNKLQFIAPYWVDGGVAATLTDSDLISLEAAPSDLDDIVNLVTIRNRPWQMQGGQEVMQPACAPLEPNINGDLSVFKCTDANYLALRPATPRLAAQSWPAATDKTLGGDRLYLDVYCQVIDQDDGDQRDCVLLDADNTQFATDGKSLFQTITLSDDASAGDETLAVDALTYDLPSGTQLVFGAVTVKLSAAASANDTTLAVEKLPAAVKSGDEAVWSNVALTLDGDPHLLFKARDSVGYPTLPIAAMNVYGTWDPINRAMQISYTDLKLSHGGLIPAYSGFRTQFRGYGVTYQQAAAAKTVTWGYGTSINKSASDPKTTSAQAETSGATYGTKELELEIDILDIAIDDLSAIAEAIVNARCNPTQVYTLEQSAVNQYPVRPEMMGKQIMLPGGVAAVVESHAISEAYTPEAIQASWKVGARYAQNLLAAAGVYDESHYGAMHYGLGHYGVFVAGGVESQGLPGASVWPSSKHGIHAFYLWDSSGLGGLSYAQLAANFDFSWSTTLATTVTGIHGIRLGVRLGRYMAYQVDMQDPKKDLAWWLANHPTWVMYAPDKTTPVNPYGDDRIALDVTNPDVVAWQIAQFATPAAANGYNVISADEFTLNNESAWPSAGHYDAGAAWMALYSGDYHDDDWVTAQIGWLTAFRTALQAMDTPMLLVPNFNIGEPAANGGRDWDDDDVQSVITNVDGILDENTFTHAGGSWASAARLKNGLDYAVSAQGQGVYFAALFYPVGGSLDDRNAYWAIAVYMLANQGLMSICPGNYHTPHYHPWLSTPIGKATQGGYQTPATGVFTREYSAGFAMLNANSSSASITLPTGSWKDLRGNLVSSPYTLAAQTARVLVPA